MKFYLISDNEDTKVGLRLVGVEGVLVNSSDGVKRELLRALAYPDVGIVLITTKLVSLCREFIYETKLKTKKPLIVEIPDMCESIKSEDPIARYVKEAIGISI